jgi:hypothetical protein
LGKLGFLEVIYLKNQSPMQCLQNSLRFEVDLGRFSKRRREIEADELAAGKKEVSAWPARLGREV